jgi:DNA-binding CsgD family transcriptional regulator
MLEVKMLDTLECTGRPPLQELATKEMPLAAMSAAIGARSYAGPERRTGPAPVQRWLAMLIDEIDYGMVLLTDDAQVAHVNHMARMALDGDHPLELQGRRIHARHPQDAPTLRDALVGAGQRSRRCLLKLGDSDRCAMVSVVPLDRENHRQPAIALILGKRQVCEPLSVQAFARAHRLTGVETKVLTALCNGARVREVALDHGVKTSTVRSQVSSIRSKTGAESIAALVRQIAVLPPLLGVLRGL